MNILAYTDGSARGNPGPGGYGIVMMIEGSSYQKSFFEGYRNTTNNRMELMAVIVCLETLKKENQSITIFSDSKYVLDAIEKKWVFAWEKKDFKDKKNPDLWKRFLLIYPKHKVKFEWVKGHAGNKYNEMADRLAVKGSYLPNPKIDQYFESSQQKA
ncbi:MAG: ribonuclease HI [Flavobacteriaceae bacterium]|nr:MAG: ribonuclease HI [Flavobacteriaceae bacterium]